MFAPSKTTLKIGAFLLGGAMIFTARGVSAQEQPQALHDMRTRQMETPALSD